MSNHVDNSLSRPPLVALTTLLHYYGHEASEWPQLYQQDPDFITTYKLLGTGVNVTNFHIHNGLLFHLVHLCVPTRERAMLRKLWIFFRNIFIGQNFDRTSASISDIALHVPLTSHPSRSKA
jgi:hypothetical protein